MKKIFVSGAALAMFAFAGTASAQNAAGQMMNLMQCTAGYNTEYVQCLASANQMTSDPMKAGSQVMTNFQGSTACGQQAMACHKGCM